MENIFEYTESNNDWHFSLQELKEAIKIEYIPSAITIKKITKQIRR